MKTYKFFVDEKVTTWMRTHFEIDANTQDEANTKAIEFIENGDHEQIPWENINDVSPEKISSVENGGQSTVEIFETKSGNVIYTNEQKE